MSQGNTRYQRRNPSEWQQLVDACEASALSQRAFCRQRGLALSTFQNWKRRLRCEPAAPASSVGVIDLGDLWPAANEQFESAPGGWVFELLVGNWLRLHLRRT